MYAPWAKERAERLLGDALPDRWAHSYGVGCKARELRDLAGEHADLLEAAAFLHDIGYAPPLVDTGFHPLDGARYLRDHTNAPLLICALVANHTCANIEAAERGLAAPLADEFPLGPSPEPELTAAITHCDLSIGPTGAATDPETRITEILARYGPGDVVHRSIEKARPLLLEQDRWVRQRLIEGRARRTPARDTATVTVQGSPAGPGSPPGRVPS